MPERTARYCAQCGTALETQHRFGRERPVCPNCDTTVFFEPKVAVVASVTRENDHTREILLVKRANDPGKGRWALPAGFVEHDEAPRLAAIRETLEETGVHIEIDGLLDVLHRPDVGGLADIVIAYAAHPIGGAVHADDDADDAGWFASDALPDIVLVSTITMIERWKEEKC